MTTEANEVELRRLGPADAEAVAALHRAAVPEAERDLTVFGSPKLGAYVAALAALPEYRGEHLLTGAFRGGELVGYTHARLLPGRWHLNYVAVRPSCQGHGVGRALWADWLRHGRERGAGRASLDVLPTNRRAAEWYRRRGMGQASSTWTCFAGDAPAAGRPHGAAVGDWEAAEAWQRAYGFSRFRVDWRDKSWDVGRLPPRFFNVGADFPPELRGVLSDVDRERAVVFTTHDEGVARQFRVARLSVRMEAALAQVV